MERSLKRTLLRLTATAAIVTGLVIQQSSGIAFAAGTTAGTVIQNTATATYQDGNSNTYTTNSNTVQTTVQNVPSLTVTPASGSNYAPGGQVTDSFTLTNTGNNTGTFTVSAITPPTGATGVSYTIGANAYPDLATLQTYLTATPYAAGNTVTIGVKYTIPTSATAGTALPTLLTATITLPLTGGAPAATSGAQSGTENDSVVADARVDLQKTGLQPGAGGNPSGTNIYYSIAANNGGGIDAKDLTSVKTLLGVANPGIFISDLIPTFGGTPVTINNIAAVTNGANGYQGTTVQIYTSLTGAAWTLYSGSGNAPAGSKYVGVYITGGTNGNELASKPSGSSNGVVTAAAVTLSFQAVPPSGNGSGNANALLNAAAAVAGGNQGAPGNVGANVIGPGIAANTADSFAAITSAGQGINYPTQAAPGAAPGGTSGASNTVGNNSPVAAGVLNGPYNNAAATGSYNGVVANNTSNDFTAVSFIPAGFTAINSGTTLGTPVGNTLGTATTVNVNGTFQNTGNAAANVVISVAAPAGWTAQIFAADGSGNPTGLSLSGAASNTPNATFSSVASNATGSYVVTYTAPVGTQAFKVNDSVVTATLGAATNTTHHELVLGGPIYMTKTQAFDGATCPGGLAVPGCKITYTLNYQNNAVSACTTPAALSSVAASVNGFVTKAGTLVITEDGTAAPNNWATYTNGLFAAATDTTTNTYTTNTVGSSKFTSTVGGFAGVLNPGCSGAITFSVVVK